MPAEQHALGDPFPPHCAVIDIHVGELKQLYNEMDPAPFRDRDLDPKAEEFIVDWSREMRRNAPLALMVHLSRQMATPEEVTSLRQAVREYFAQSASHARAELRQLLREGRWSLLIGLLFLAVAIVLGDLLIGPGRSMGLRRDSRAQPADRRMGRAVAALRDFSLRVVADPG